MEDIKKRIEELSREIRKHNKLYYVKGVPSISDSKYDALVKELKGLEKKHPAYVLKDSPTKQVGSPIPEKLEKREHTQSMLSLDSAHSEEDIIRFDKTCSKELKEKICYMCEPKLDGISIELVYEDGIFSRGVTRGDGEIGEDVTLNLKTIKSVPGKLNIKKSPKLFAVRGEVMMHIKDFQDLNKNQVSVGKEPFANPRNVVAGSMRQLDPSITASRKLNIYCYRILYSSSEMPKTQNEALRFMSECGFQIAPKTKICKNINEVLLYHHLLEEERDDLNYEIDGVVVKINEFDSQKLLGTRTTNPRWAIAYKFQPRKEITKVEDIVIQVGRTGVLTPLALLQSVEVGGVTVSRASLHNMDQIKRLGVKIGDYVKIERAGDVIPYVSEVLKEKRKGHEKEFNMPKKCPSCGTPIEKEEVFYRCPAGLGCPAQIIEAISHYVSKGAVDIEGFSDKTTELLYEKSLIKTISDIYTLKREDLLSLEGWKEKKTNNILEAIENSKNITLERFIFGLGIRNVGKHIASLLAKKFGTLDNIISSAEEDLLEINEVGPEIAKTIVHFFNEKKNIEEIDKLKKYGVNIEKKEKKISGKFLNKNIVFTGSLVKMSRNEAKDMVEKEGGTSGSTVTNDTDFVVAGEKAGSKLDKAKERGIKILTEDEFINIIEQED